MSGPCLSCLGEMAEGEYHPRCLQLLFRTGRPPTVDVELGKLHALGLAMAGHVSLSGTQRKISLGLSTDRMTLQLAIEGGRYILKPQAQTYPALPENEHATMQLARAAGIDTPPNAIVRLADGSLAYVVVRFDRTAEGRKVRQDDFCQLAEKSPKENYDGSAELCARLVKQFATEPLIEVLKLYRLLVFSWWVGNGDMHLKNFSLVATPDGRQALAPVYDQVCTRLVIPGDQLALLVGGRKDGLDRATWLEFARYCGLPARAAERVLHEVPGALAEAAALIGRSLLPVDMKRNYDALLRERSAVLA